MSLSYIKIYLDASDTVDLLSDASAGRLMKALLHYGSGILDDLAGAEKLVFTMLRAQLDRDAADYESLCERQRANGSKGGRPKKPTGFSEKPKKPTGFSDNPQFFAETQKSQEKEEEKEKEEEYSPPYGGESITRAGARENIPPKMGEIMEYAKSEGLDVDVRRFYSYYSANGWMFSGKPMVDWKAALQYWETSNKKMAAQTEDDARRSYDLERAMAEMKTVVPKLKKKGSARDE